MFRSNRKSHRRIYAGGLAILLALSAGCATAPEEEEEGNVARDTCPPGQALVCTRRMGREEQCSCQLEEGFDEMMRPMRR